MMKLNPKTLYTLSFAGLVASFNGFSSDNGCLSGVFAVDRFGNSEKGILHHIDVLNKVVTPVPGLNETASNLAGKDDKFYIMKRLDAATNASKIYVYDASTGTQQAIADTTSFRIKRSSVSPSGDFLLATSQTYMYEFDLSTGEKTILGKMNTDDATYSEFTHGDIAYSADGNQVYVLNSKSLYTLDFGDMTLDKIGEHNLNWASGLAVSSDGTIYASARNSGENAKIYTLDPNTAQAVYVMDGSRNIADLTYVTGCVSALPSIASLLQERVNEAHAFWLSENQTGAVANLAGFRDGSFNFSETGYPIESADINGNHNKIVKHPNANRCARVWNSLLEHQYTLNQSGQGGKKADGSTKWYFSTADGDYKVVQAQSGLCKYGLADDTGSLIVYDTTSGVVSIQN